MILKKVLRPKIMKRPPYPSAIAAAGWRVERAREKKLFNQIRIVSYPDGDPLQDLKKPTEVLPLLFPANSH